MNCYKCKQIIDKIHIDCVNDNELQSVLRHIQECDECKLYYNVMNEMVEDLHSFKEVELPEGFSNKLHFALKRESETPANNRTSLVKGLKLAAIGAFSIVAVLAVVSLIPKKMYDAMPNMAREESLETEAMDYAGAEMEIQAVEEMAEMLMIAVMDETEDAEAEKNYDNSFEGETLAEETCEETTETATSCESLIEAGSMVLIISAEDKQAVYDDLVQYFPDNLPETSWPFTDIEEPDEYLQLRQIMDKDVAQHLSGDLASDYARSLDLYAARMIEYDNWNNETADLQNIGYIFIIIK